MMEKCKFVAKQISHIILWWVLGSGHHVTARVECKQGEKTTSTWFSQRKAITQKLNPHP